MSSRWLAHFRGTDDITEGFQSGRPLMLVARNSTQGGNRGRDLAAQELYSIAESLKTRHGIDIVSELPSKADLMARLKAAKSVKSQGTGGKAFSHSYVHLQICGGEVYVLLATGSGRKLTSEFEQPFVSELIQTVKAVHPALVYCHVLDRLFRHAMSAAPLLTVLKELDVALGDDQRHPFRAGGFNDIQTIWKASGSQEEAEKIPHQTRSGMVRRTEGTLVNGSCQYSLAPTPPPGFARLRMLSEKGGLGKSILVLDDPACYPDPARVAIGLPLVSKDDVPVNQVELVRHVLAHLGKPGHGLAEMGRYLADRHFSTDGLRKTHGPDAHFGQIDLGGSDYRPLRGITRNLAVYESGEWTVLINAGGYTHMKLTNMMPLDGRPWASPEDFERIRRYLEKTNKLGGKARLALTGIPVTVDGNAGFLRAADETRDPERKSYSVSGPKGTSRRFNFPALPHNVLAESIVGGLAAAADRVWIPADDNVIDPRLKTERDRAQAAVERLERIVEGLSDQIAEQDEQGRPLLTRETRVELSGRQARVINDELEPAREALQVVETRIAAEVKRMGEDMTGTPVNLLNRLIERLANPTDTTYQEWWKSSTTIHFRREELTIAGHDGYSLTWTGNLSLHQHGKRFDVPFTGNHTVGSACHVDSRIDAIVDAMRDGIPFPDVPVERARELRKEVALRLGQHSRRFLIGNILDPRVLRIAVHIAENSNAGDQAIANHFQEPVELVQRVRYVITSRPSGYRWIRHQQTLLASCLAIAAGNNGTIKRGAAKEATGSPWGSILRAFRLRLPTGKPMEKTVGGSLRIPKCPHCASRRRSLSRLNEPVGFICLNCRKDEMGISWPADPYDKWLETS